MSSTITQREVVGVRRRQFAIPLALALAALIASAGSTWAYDGVAAANWADDYALNPNCQISPCLSNDCAAFVSQALHFGGGYPYIGMDGDIHNYNFWWEKHIPYAGFAFSDTWGGVAAHHYFQAHHIPGGADYGSVVPGSAQISSGRSKGDLFFYDWTNNGSLDHVGMMVGNGADPSKPGWSGDWQDQHSPGHYHAFWTLAPYNADAFRTRIDRMKIYATN